MLMHMRARYRSSLVFFGIFECTPTRRNIIFFIYILIGPHRHGSKENPSHRSSAVFISSLCLFFFFLFQIALFSESLSLLLLRDHPLLDLSRVLLFIALIPQFSSFIYLLSHGHLFYNYLSIFARSSLPAFIPECHLHVMVVSSFQATYKRSLL